MKVDLFGVPVIDSFRGKYGFLSNVFDAVVIVEDIEFATSEHAYHWKRTTNPKEQEYIRSAPTPVLAKQRSKEIKTRSDWRQIDFEWMKTVNFAKFTQHSDLQQKLIDTDNAIIIEGNLHHDNRWGSCRCPKCKDKGLNYLGKIHMFNRERFVNQ